MPESPLADSWPQSPCLSSRVDVLPFSSESTKSGRGDHKGLQDVFIMSLGFGALLSLVAGGVASVALGLGAVSGPLFSVGATLLYCAIATLWVPGGITHLNRYLLAFLGTLFVSLGLSMPFWHGVLLAFGVACLSIYVLIVLMQQSSMTTRTIILLVGNGAIICVVPLAPVMSVVVFSVAVIVPVLIDVRMKRKIMRAAGL